MKALFALALSIFLLLPTAHAQSKRTFYFSWDIDWTVLNPVGPEDQRPNFIYDGKRAEIMPYTAASFLMLWLAGHEIIINSGGTRERNELFVNELYSEVMNLARRNGIDPELIPMPLILSIENMSLDPDGRSTDRFRYQRDKNILAPEKLDRKFPERDIMHADDISEFAVKGQEHLLLAIKPTYNNFKRYAEVARSEGLDSAYLPPDKFSWVLDRMRVPWIAQVAIEAKQIAEANSTPLWAEVARLMIDPAAHGLPEGVVGVEKLSLARYQDSRDSPRQIERWKRGLKNVKAIAKNRLPGRCLKAVSPYVLTD